MSIQDLYLQRYALLLFQDVLADSVGQAFTKLLGLLATEAPARPTDLLQTYGQFFQQQAATGYPWRLHLVQRLLVADNSFSQHAARQPDPAKLSPALVVAVRHDLQILQGLASYDLNRFSQLISKLTGVRSLPTWSADLQEPLSTITQKFLQATHWVNLIEELAEYYHQAGVGLLAQYKAFRWYQGKLVGITQPDPVTLADLTGYPAQRDLLLKNTEALLLGYPALHVLLYGGRGTGKSSLVKALLNQYCDRGLRLIEVAKADLIYLPIIIEQLQQAPQKFIVFVDDLSFETDEHSYTALKVVLEGSLASPPDNLVVYATSNRRHLVREYHTDRPRPSLSPSTSQFDPTQAEVHGWDTVQEKLSFSDRFGLTLTFVSPDQEAYLTIVRHLASRAQLDLPSPELEAQALQWATRHHGRSGRTAQQFIDFMQCERQLQHHQERALDCN